MRKNFLFKTIVLMVILSLVTAFSGCSQNTAPGGAMGKFEAEIIGEDEVFTEKDLAEYDLTVVNIWATWCGYCIYEMPDLQEFSRILPENINFISVCTDGDKMYDTAKAVLDANGCTFTTIIPDDALNVSLIPLVQVLPTTFFIDSKGNVVGDPHMGLAAAVNGSLAEGYLALAEERLAMLK